MIAKPLTIEFPLRGEWRAPTTPAKQIPSHGTNRMGLRYAFDFFQIDKDRQAFHRSSHLRYLLLGVPLSKCYCWGENIYAPCDGEIVVAEDGVRERRIVHWFVDSLNAIRNALFFNERKDDFRQIAGNYLVIKYADNVYLLFAHLQKDSISVTLNQKVKKGDLLGKVGHSGNSTSPHLHFQVMDRCDFANAQGISCNFAEYELFQNGEWQTVYQQIPSDQDWIRFNKN